MDFPTEGDGKENLFAWRDGPFLKALKAGHWILLDEVTKLEHKRMVLSILVHCSTSISPESVRKPKVF